MAIQTLRPTQRNEKEPNPMNGACCPECGSCENGVVDSRNYQSGLKRRRKCYHCLFRWSTLEIPEKMVAYSIVQNLDKAIKHAKAMLRDLENIRNSSNNYVEEPQEDLNDAGIVQESENNEVAQED